MYNPHASFPCSLMPRFGSNKVLTIDQIKDLVALLMSPESPVNK
jgi:sulfur-oxidizing protein SoxX